MTVHSLPIQGRERRDGEREKIYKNQTILSKHWNRKDDFLFKNIFSSYVIYEDKFDTVGITLFH